METFQLSAMMKKFFLTNSVSDIKSLSGFCRSLLSLLSSAVLSLPSLICSTLSSLSLVHFFYITPLNYITSFNHPLSSPPLHSLGSFAALRGFFSPCLHPFTDYLSRLWLRHLILLFFLYPHSSQGGIFDFRTVSHCCGGNRKSFYQICKLFQLSLGHLTDCMVMFWL